MAKMMSDANDQWPYKQAPVRDHGRGRAREKGGWITEVLEEARAQCEALPPDVVEAALQSGTRATVRG